MPITKLGIGTPTEDGKMEARTAFCLATAMSFVRVPMQPFLAIGPYVHHNRDVIVRQAMDAQCSHLMMIDTDMMFEHDAINKLIERDLDIVGANYNKKILPIQPIVTGLNGEIKEVPFVPTGFLLVNMDVFTKIGKPWFSFMDDAESEDVYFCEKAKKNGFKIFCDPSIKIGHLGTAVF